MKYKFKPSHIVPAFLFVVAVLYGGSKPSMPTNAPPLLGVGVRSRSTVESSNLHCTTTTANYDSLTAWHKRGAYCDWERIDFPDAFRFPVGTNFIDGVTLFAYGEVRIKRGSAVSALVEDGSSASSTSGEDAASPLSGAPTTYTYQLPTRVSLEPNASSVSHGLTPSNSYLFAWHNCCVERSATNRVNASIELFRSGAVAITTTPTNGLPTTVYQLPTLPEGWIGIGQDEDWIRATFPDEADTILMEEYDSWLLNTWTGINEANGHCLVRVTIDPSAFNQAPGTTNQAPSTLHQAPTYLACGPYRVNVVAPGTYSFPLEVSTTYHIRTYPTAMPLQFEFDDGYRGNGTSFHVVDGEHPVLEPPRRMMLAAPPPPSSDYWKTIVPDLVVDPKHIPLNRVENTPLRVWCNIRDFVLVSIESAAYLSYYVVSRDEAALDRADEAMECYACVQAHNAYMRGEFWIDPAIVTNNSNSVTNRTDAWIFSGEPRHTEVRDDNRMIRYATAVSGGDASDISWSLNLAEGQSVYVAVFMATVEYPHEQVYNDSVSWSVSSNGGGALSGTTTIVEQEQALASARQEANCQYGFIHSPMFLAGQRFNSPGDDILRLSIRVSASDAVDNLRETCVQVAVYPIDDQGNVVGKPDWLRE